MRVPILRTVFRYCGRPVHLTFPAIAAGTSKTPATPGGSVFRSVPAAAVRPTPDTDPGPRPDRRR